MLSFSLNPLLLGRALLPSVGQSLFSEYVAFLPITALVLAVIGAWQWRRWPGVLPALALILFGLFLAFGAFNPALLAAGAAARLQPVPRCRRRCALWGRGCMFGFGGGGGGGGRGARERRGGARGPRALGGGFAGAWAWFCCFSQGRWGGVGGGASRRVGGAP
ncbi:MAG: hypothetical protein M5U34_43995 [Chloroflexi bacterium]|nr:hypothetical protein [Chloroflexota bacterium]